MVFNLVESFRVAVEMYWFGKDVIANRTAHIRHLCRKTYDLRLMLPVKLTLVLKK
jgi:hypothetical protein